MNGNGKNFATIKVLGIGGGGTNAVNRMRIECLGSTLRFYVNETFLGEVEDSSFTGGQIGLMAGSFKDGEGVHVVFDNVVVYDY